MQARLPDKTHLRLVGTLAPSPKTPTFEDLFRRYAPYVGAIGLRLLGRDSEVDDLVQEVFILAHTNLDQLRDADKVKPWLSTIAVRLAHKRMQKTWYRRFLRSSPIEEYESLVDPAATPEQRAQVIQVYQHLEQLPADDRITWLLRHTSGETLEQIATVCECSVSTVQRRLRSAEQRISKVFAGREER